jgi:simple sugar transport system permease protein
MRVPWLIEPRLHASPLLSVVPPLAAVVATVLGGIVLLTSLGIAPATALYQLFVAPFSSAFNVGEVLLKATPLLLVAQGLAIGFRAKVWNIGAEGQLILGAIGGSLLPVLYNDSQTPWILVGMAIVGTLCGMGWAAVAAGLRTRFNANEILVTLMMNSLALQLLYYLVSGPLRDPMGFNFPQSAPFPEVALMPTLGILGRVNIGLPIALGLSLVAWVFMERSFMGYKLQVGGAAPDAARYAGFKETRAIWLSLLIGGAAAGLAGVLEVAGPLGQLQRVVSPGYGFAAIIVAFLGGLNAIGIVFAALFMAVIYVGGDIAQASAGVPYAVISILQGVMLVSYIAARLFVDYRVIFPFSRLSMGK